MGHANIYIQYIKKKERQWLLNKKDYLVEQMLTFVTYISNSIKLNTTLFNLKRIILKRILLPYKVYDQSDGDMVVVVAAAPSAGCAGDCSPLPLKPERDQKTVVSCQLPEACCDTWGLSRQFRAEQTEVKMKQESREVTQEWAEERKRALRKSKLQLSGTELRGVSCTPPLIEK